MRAVTYHGPKNMRVTETEDPKLHKSDDILIKVTTSGICGSDIHLYNGLIPNLKHGTVIGHEPMGIVEEVGPDVTKVKKGDRVVIPFNVSCGTCQFCTTDRESLCDESNPGSEVGAYFGFSDTYGGYGGGQAEYMRVPYGNFIPFKVPDNSELTDEQIFMLSDVIPTAWWSVENGGVKSGDIVIILGCGPIGLMAQKFAWMKGASRVIAIDYIPSRLAHAKLTNKVETYNFEEIKDIEEHIKEITKGGGHVVIDAVGLDGKKTPIEEVETWLKMQGGTIKPFRMAAHMVKKGGTIQMTGVYGLFYHAFPLGHIWERNITLKMGQAPVIHYMPMLYDMIKDGKFDPTDIITHRLTLDEAIDGYHSFVDREEGCFKVVLKPNGK